jgi:LL-diaminopimelate aminotransferase
MDFNNKFIAPANRIAHSQPYFFSSLNQKISALREQGMDVIRLDMGSPDLPPADFIIDTMVQAARKPDTHGYSAIGGPQAYRQAIAGYYSSRFNVDLDSKSEVLGLIGSKEGLFNLSQVLVNPGDYVLVPDPGYPVYTSGGEIAGGTVYYMPLTRANNFLPDLKAIPATIADRAKILWLNYPNNPTGAVATLDYFKEAVDFACEHHLVIAHDAPYVDICFDDYHAPSILQVEGAKKVAVEFNSLAKTYNMAGWRLGMAVGNPQVLSYLNNYKSHLDTSQFQPLYEGGVAALLGDQGWLEERNNIYKQRRDVLLASLRQVGFDVQTPPAAIYIWALLPEGLDDSIDFCERLLAATGVSMTPGDVYGVHGKGYVRVSLGTPQDRIEEAMQRLIAWMNAGSVSGSTEVYGQEKS